MSRIRTIKPDLTMDEELAELGFAARYFFENLFCHCDREGRCEDRPKMLQAKILPWDHDVDADTLLNELHPHFVLRYEVDGERYLWVRKFLKHQRPHPNEPESEIPQPPQHLLKESCKKISNREETRQECKEGKGKEGKGKEGNVMVIGPEAPAKPQREDTGIQKIVNAYKIAKGVAKTDKAWDRANYGRYSKAAKSILEAFGSVERSVAYVICKGDEFTQKDISWTLETISRHAHDDKGRICGHEDSEMGTDGLLGVRGPDQLSCGGDGGGKEEPENIGIMPAGDHFGGVEFSGVPEAEQTQ